MKTLERESSKKNKATSTNAFITDLKEEIESRDNTDEANITGGYVEQVLVTRSQADSVIAKRALEGKSHLIIRNDSDDSQLYCMECDSVSLLAPEAINSKRIDEMKHEMKDDDEYIIKRSLDIIKKAMTASDGEKGVVYPLFPSNMIDNNYKVEQNGTDEPHDKAIKQHFYYDNHSLVQNLFLFVVIIIGSNVYEKRFITI